MFKKHELLLWTRYTVHNNHSAPTAPVKRNNKPYIKSLSFKTEDL